ncbi:MAG: M17 family peptidase N-terminal domain-containing protein, partial [Caldilinea sp.]
MQFATIQGNITHCTADCLVVNLFEGVSTPGGATGAVDAALDSALHTLIASRDFDGKAGDTALLYTHGRLPAPRVLVVGLGKAEKFDTNGARKAAAVAYKALARLKGVQHFATIVHGAGSGSLDATAAAQAVAEGTALAAYRAPSYRRTAPDSGPTACTVVENDPLRLPDIAAGVRRGEQIAASVNLARTLSNEPPNLLYPAEIAQRARTMAATAGLQCTVLGEETMRELGMHILLAVSRGS